MIEIKHRITGEILKTVDADNLTRADLTHADLTHANLTCADLAYSDLARADLTFSDLMGADLTHANLTGANLMGADLAYSNLTGADLTYSNLAYSNLTGADLSGALGLLSAPSWVAAHFRSDDLGVIVYRVEIGQGRPKPTSRHLEPGTILEEVCNPCRTQEWGSGVHFGTAKWLLGARGCNKDVWWECRIRWIDLAGVTVPYNTDGKARCERLELIRVVTPEEVQEIADALEKGGKG